MSYSRITKIGFVGLACSLCAFALATAQESRKPTEASANQKAQEAEKQDAATDEVIQKADQLLGHYNQTREQALDANETTLKDIDKMIKEAADLNAQRYQMILLSATLRARSVVSNRSEANSLTGKESLHRELQAVHAQLRQELDQVRSQVGQSAAQLEALRGQLSRPKAVESAVKTAKPAKEGAASKTASPLHAPE